jgi:hypothetical protein
MESYVMVENIEAKAAAWLERIRPFNQHEMRLNASASATPTSRPCCAA